MKRLMKWLIPLLLAALLVCSAVWYVLVYDRSTVRDFLSAQAQNSAKNGHFETATWLYNLSYQFSGSDENVAIELAKAYMENGNFTKAEYTLANAIAGGPTTELYAALCQVYVAQDKLLDAVNMLDNISDPQIKAELDALRPATPEVDYAPGYYSQYITLTFQTEGGALYVSSDGEYPTTEDLPSEGTLTLPGGETKVYALVVSQDGLVSPLSISSYTIGGVIEEVTLSDAAIEASFRELLCFGQDTTIYTSDLWTITEFTVPEEAESLEDLSYLIYLEALTIEGRKLDSLAFLSDMSQLKTLCIRDCALSADLSPIGALSNLTALTLSDCDLASISGLEGAQSLRVLDLSRNMISKIDVLADMTMLETVDLSDNAVTGLKSLSGLTQLKTLDVSGNAISSMAPLASCTALSALDVSNNTLTSLSGISTLVNLTSLSASYNSLSDVSGLASCTKLTYLGLAHNSITDLSEASGLAKLLELDISYNAVTALPNLPEDCSLVTLKADYNQIADISVLGGMDNLNCVYLDYNQVTNISPLVKCYNLILVNVYGNAVDQNVVNQLLDMSVIVNYDPTYTGETEGD